MTPTATRIANSGTTDYEVNVAGDGNCFFRAILVAIEKKNLNSECIPESQYNEIREQVVACARELPKFKTMSQSLFSAYYGFRNINEWAGVMQFDGVWADCIAVEACSELFGIPISIYVDGGSKSEPYVERYGLDYLYCHEVTNIDNMVRLVLRDHHYSVMI